MDSDETIFLFTTIPDLMAAEMLCLGEGFHYRIEPIPTSISSECGMCIVLDNSSTMLFKTLLDSHHLTCEMVPRNTIK